MFFYTSLQSPLFAQESLCFALTDRLDGVSSAPFTSLNLGYHTGDRAESVSENHQRLRRGFSEVFGLQDCALHYLSQVHSTRYITLEDFYAEGIDQSSLRSLCVGEADAIITNMPHQGSLVMVADCNPVLIYDRLHQAMAVIHAGRKGVLDGIVAQSFQAMRERYGSRAEDCLVYIGASIRGCCYEVGEEVRREVVECGFAGALKGRKLDLIACLSAQLSSLGFYPHHIEIDPHCTHCSQDLYSYRREGQTGRFGLVAMLRT